LKSAFSQNKDEDSSKYRPNDIHVCKWATDPRFCGSYSFMTVGALNGKPSTYEQLIAPLSPGVTKKGD